jgi:hypothetical protein
MAFRDLDEFWVPHTMAGTAAAQRYVSGLDDERKAALREQLRATLPIAADGSLHLTERLRGVRGKAERLRGRRSTVVGCLLSLATVRVSAVCAAQ